MANGAVLLIVGLLFLSTLSFNLNLGLSGTGYELVLVGYWKFDEGSGIMAFDSSGYGNDGELTPNVGGPSWTAGISGTALQFDGTKDYVNVSDSDSLDITGNIRIETWIKPHVNDKLMNIVSKRGLLGNYSYTLNMGVLPNPAYPEKGNPGAHPGKIGFIWASDGTPATQQYLVSNAVVPTNKWTNVTVLYDGSFVKIYIDGNLDNSTAYTGSLYAGNADLFIGYTADGSSYFFDGVIDEVKISRTFPFYDATIKAHCDIEGVDVSVSITMDGAPTGFKTPHTFTKTGTHTFTVPDMDAKGHPFWKWSTGWESTTITVSAAGTYMAYYRDPLQVEDHDVAVINIAPSRTLAYQGYTVVNIDVWVKNNGTTAETFCVTAYRNSIEIGTQTVTDLAPDATTMLTFSWDTAGVPFGNYTVSASATPVPGETYLTDNSLTDGSVVITIPGDVNGDRTVNVLDAGSLSAHWYPGPPIGPLGYDSHVDIDNDGNVNILDVGIASAHWGQSW